MRMPAETDFRVNYRHTLAIAGNMPVYACRRMLVRVDSYPWDEAAHPPSTGRLSGKNAFACE